MSQAIREATVLILAYYASKGRFPRPHEVSEQDLNEVQRLGAAVARDLMKIVKVPDQGNNKGLRREIEILDKQVDTYENQELLVSSSEDCRNVITKHKHFRSSLEDKSQSRN